MAEADTIQAATEFRIIYDENRFPLQQKRADGTYGCRGCGGVIPKGRSAWCSTACCKKYNPAQVRFDCEQRDHGICCECGVDTRKVQARFPENTRRYPLQWHPRFWKDGKTGSSEGFLTERFERARKIHDKYFLKIVAAAAKRRERMMNLGWPKNIRRDFWEMDHIISFSEGGLTVLENVRTLCRLCHVARTAKWHWEKVEKRRSQLTLV